MFLGCRSRTIGIPSAFPSCRRTPTATSAWTSAGNRLYVQYINSVWGVFDDTGALIAGPFAGNTFWTGFGGFCETNNDGDPVVLYDDTAGRWFFSQFSVNRGYPVRGGFDDQ